MAGMELLLLSNSTNYGGTMFSHAAEAFAGVAAGDTVTFVPYALSDWDDYADRATAALAAFDIDVISAHRSSAPEQAILEADVLMMGGGNTFRLLDSLYALNVIEELGLRVREGAIRYVSASAGTNVACPTIRTTNDMPICRPPSFAALGLLPFQIISTSSMPIRLRRSWARPGRNESKSSLRRTIARCWRCTRAPGCGSVAGLRKSRVEPVCSTARASPPSAMVSTRPTFCTLRRPWTTIPRAGRPPGPR